MKWIKIIALIFGSILLLLAGLWFLFVAKSPTKSISLANYYAYDQELPLKDSIQQILDTTDFTLFYATFQSVHNQQVTSLLSIPKTGQPPYPTIILMHGVGDRKTVDYVEAGNTLLTQAGYAVLRLDTHNHGDRKTDDYDFDLREGLKYWTRNTITQTVFDLQRAVDFLEIQPAIDAERIGYYGISLGGIIGTIFCGLDDRIKAPVIAIAGGSLHLLFGKNALDQEVQDYVSVIDPINFVENIAPRPLLMINAENDEVIPPITSKLLFQQAKKPKEIIWYPTTHKTVPLEKVYQDGIDWFDKYLKDEN